MEASQPHIILRRRDVERKSCSQCCEASVFVAGIFVSLSCLPVGIVTRSEEIDFKIACTVRPVGCRRCCETSWRNTGDRARKVRCSMWKGQCRARNLVTGCCCERDIDRVLRVRRCGTGVPSNVMRGVVKNNGWPLARGHLHHELPVACVRRDQRRW